MTEYPPEIWLAGCSRQFTEQGDDPVTAVGKALKVWMEQARLEELYNKQVSERKDNGQRTEN